MNHHALQQHANRTGAVRLPRHAAKGRSMTVRRRRRAHLSALAARAGGRPVENVAMLRRAQEKEWRITARYERYIPHAPRCDPSAFED